MSSQVARVVGAVLAAAVFAGCAARPEPSAMPAESPSAAVSEAPSPSTVAQATPTGPPLCHDGLPLRPGRYLLSEEMTQTIPVTITFPEGWKGCGLAFKELGGEAGVMMVGFWEPVHVYANPCHWRDSHVGPTASPGSVDLVQAFLDQELTVASPPDEAVINGHRGRHLRFEVPGDLDTSTCDVVDIAEFRFMDGPGDSVWWVGAADAPGLIAQVWFVNGVLIQTAAYADAGEARQDELAAIVGSVRFEP